MSVQTVRSPSLNSTPSIVSVGSTVVVAPTVAPVAGSIEAGTPVRSTVGAAGGSGGTMGWQLFGPTTVIVASSLAVWPIESSAIAVIVRAVQVALFGIVKVMSLSGGVATPTWVAPSKNVTLATPKSSPVLAVAVTVSPWL